MRIFQILPVLAFGDAVGNDTRALKDVLVRIGIETEIYADVVDNRLPLHSAKHISELPEIIENDIILYHLSTGHELNHFVTTLRAKLVVIYHNVTPEKYFYGYNQDAYKNCYRGIRDTKMLAKYADYALADSEYNRQELITYGYKCEVDVLPILIPFEDYKKKPSEKIIKRYSDGKTNILFTGRIAPNKKHEDLITSFYYYKKNYNVSSRLILAGSYAGMDNYYQRLLDYIHKLGLEDDVVMPGMSKFNEILAYYHVADVFLCMSEHEGFCVPLVESMFFDIPIVARNTTAIEWTLGGSGFLFDGQDPIETAGIINRVLTDEELRKNILYNQRIRLKGFSNKIVEKSFQDFLDNKIAKL